MAELQTPAAVRPETVALSAPAADMPLLVDAAAASRLYGVSRTSFYQLRALGRVVRPIRLGKRIVRWRVREIKMHIEAGCPPVDRWELLKGK
jgi:predicted DNA-binding transcriptional regulator AlpA